VVCKASTSPAACARFNPPPPAIVITGDTDPDTLAQLRASGFGGLIKPIDAETLGALASAQVASVA
jgi:AmiR/NasT family two-component response regulator